MARIDGKHLLFWLTIANPLGALGGELCEVMRLCVVDNVRCDERGRIKEEDDRLGIKWNGGVG